MALGRVDDALSCFKRALALEPRNFEVQTQLGVVYQKLGSNDEAIFAFKRAINLNPDHVEGHCRLGDLYSDIGLTKEAIDCYRECLKLSPSAEVQEKLGAAYRTFCFSSKYLAGEADSEKLMRFLLTEQDPDLTFSFLADFLKTNNHDPEVFYLCAARLLQALNGIAVQKKQKLLETLAAVRAKLAAKRAQRTLYWLGKIYYGLDLYEDCKEVFQNSIEWFGPDDKSFYYLGACNEVKGEFGAALNYYKEALRLDPGCLLTLDGIERMKARIAAQPGEYRNAPANQPGN